MLKPVALKPLAPVKMARSLRQAGYLLDAFLIYDWYIQHVPWAICLRQERDSCRDLLIQHHPALKPEQRLFTSPLHSEDSVDARLLSCLIRHTTENKLEHLRQLVARVSVPSLQLPLAMSWYARSQDWLAWAEMLGRYLDHCQLAGVPSITDTVAIEEQPLLARLKISSQMPTRTTNSFVTVVMAAHNAAATMQYAVRSILDQTHRNLELIFINDASTDSTPEMIAALASQDDRISVIHNRQRRGTYASRNQGLAQARGSFVANHDADDYAHPDRLGHQVRRLMRDEAAPAVLGQWLRIRNDGQVKYHNRRGGGFLHGALATIMLRREVVERIGYYDPVLCSADTEYLFRIRRVWGHRAVPVIRRPLVFAASLDTGLTANDQLGTDSFLGDSPSRSQYRQAWQAWQQSTAPQDLYLAANQQHRSFPAPRELLP